jgi:hypothetical protein
VIPVLIGITLFSFSARHLRAQNAPAETRTAAPSTGTITGRIVNQSGERMTGATAWALPIGVIGQSRTTSVDGNGDFKFEGLEAGVYSISGNLPGFVPAPTPVPDESRSYYRLGDSVTVALIKGGVITGTVTTSTNLPVVAASVKAFRIRDANGKPDQFLTARSQRQTDDRGVYRFYGLPPGTYIVSVGGWGQVFGGMSSGAYDNDAPTYAPSSTRDTAMEMVVAAGEEITADIQYRGESGQAVSGTLSGLSQSAAQLMSIASGTVTLTEVNSRTMVTSVLASPMTNNTFVFYGVPVGEYELVGQQTLPTRDLLVSEPKRVKVQGADVTGISLTLAPLAGIAGRILVEGNPPADCVKRRATTLQETVITANRSKPETKPATGKTAKAEPPAGIPLTPSNQNATSVPDGKGDFLLRNLQAGSYRIDSQLPGLGWYLKAITMGPLTTATKTSPVNIPRDGVNLKSGERAAGLTVTISEGAAALRGRLSVTEGQRVPPGMRIYLVPAEREAAENILRFFETPAESDAGFAINNIAPGRYWILARPSDDDDPSKLKRIKQDSALRAKVLREAGDAKKEVLLQRCERVTDFDLSYPFAAPQP